MGFHGRTVLFVAALAIVSILGCTRQVEEKSTISLTIPTFKSAGVQAVPDHLLAILIVNVQGPGLPGPIYRFIEHTCMKDEHAPGCQDLSTVGDLAGTIEIADVPNGSDRLVQVMGVFIHRTTKNMKFYYGDSLVALNGS